MKLLKQFIFLTVCGLMTFRGVVAMEEAQGGVAGETEVVESDKQPVDGAAEASAPAGVLSEKQRKFLREKCLALYQEKHDKEAPPELDRLTTLVKECDDATLFLVYLHGHFAYVATTIFGFEGHQNDQDDQNDQIVGSTLDIVDFLDNFLIKFCGIEAAFYGKKLVLKKEQQFESFDFKFFIEGIKAFASSLKAFTNYYYNSYGDLTHYLSLVNEIKSRLLTLVAAVFAEGEELHEITYTIEYSFTDCLAAIQKEAGETEIKE